MKDTTERERKMRTISLSEVWHEAKIMALYEWIAGRKLPQPLMACLIFLAVVKAWVMAETLCKWRGHKWETESLVTPGAGWESFTCVRCNHQHHVTYF